MSRAIGDRGLGQPGGSPSFVRGRRMLRIIRKRLHPTAQLRLMHTPRSSEACAYETPSARPILAVTLRDHPGPGARVTI